jgi:uncharacterized protein DUF3568
MVSGHMAKQNTRVFVAVLAFGAMSVLPGCAAVGLTLFSVGAGVTTGTSVAYTLDGVAYKTFTAPLPKVENATRTALDRMGIRIEATSTIEQGKAIKALSNDRDIEIELEMVSNKTTRIRSVAKQGFFFKDRATATEIIIQTEKALGLG